MKNNRACGQKSAFTLLEILVAVILIGILAGIAIPNYTKTKERALDKEAQTALELIRSAQKMYSVKADGAFYPAVANTGVKLESVNSGLQLKLYSTSWDYGVNIGADTASFNATASRLNSPSGWLRTWVVASDTAAPACSSSFSGSCP